MPLGASSEIFDRKPPRRTGLAAGSAALLVGLTSCVQFDHLTRVNDEFPRAGACAECHVEIAREWSASPHARSFTNAAYQAATDAGRFRDCLGCHVPPVEMSEALPTPRSSGREEGVTCVSCHLRNGELGGPFPTTAAVVPHPVRVDPARYRDSRLCGRCHEGTYLQWSAADPRSKPVCQQCHMAPVRRKITQGKNMISNILVSFEEEGNLRRHTFAPVPRELDSPPVAVTARRRDGKLVLTVENRLPHAIPTGDFGLRIVVLEVAALTPAGTGQALGRRELATALGSAIPSGSSVEWLVDVPEDTRTIRFRMVRGGESSGGIEIFGCEFAL